MFFSLSSEKKLEVNVVEVKLSKKGRPRKNFGKQKLVFSSEEELCDENKHNLKVPVFASTEEH
jgi:hypothetical protein